MKKLFLVLALLIPFNLACHKGKSAETEMQLPTPVSISTPTPILSPTPQTTEQPTPTPTPALQYSIEDIKGTALILPSDSTVPESAEIGESVEPGDELLTKDNSEITLALNDNTMIHIAANSQVKVALLTPNATHGFSSRLDLILGNLLSEVEKLNESQSSFEVEAGGVVCGVRGTAFEVQNQDGNVSTSTFHGVVEMKKDGQTQLVKDKQHSTFSFKQSGFLAQRHISPAENKHYQTWVGTKAMVQKNRENRRNNRNAHEPVKKLHPPVNKNAQRMTKHKPTVKTKPARALQLRAKVKKAIPAQSKAKKKMKKQATLKSKPQTRQQPQKIKAQTKVKPSTRLAKPQKQPQKPQRPATKQPPKKKKRNN